MKLLTILPIISFLTTFCSAAKFASCSGVYGPRYSNKINPFINVTFQFEPTHKDINYTTLIFHYTDIKNSNIPQFMDFENPDDNSLKICDEEAIQNRECRELGKFIVNYRESNSRIYNEVLNFNERSFLEYRVMETGLYCVYIQTLQDVSGGDYSLDVQFQQPYGYLSFNDVLKFNTLASIQLPIVTLLLLIISGRFIYAKFFKDSEISLIQRAIFHYTYLIYLKTFVKFLRLWWLNSVDAQVSKTAAVFSLLLIVLVDAFDSITWGLILIISQGFGTLYDKSTFPKAFSKKIILFMAINFFMRVVAVSNLGSNISVLNEAGSINPSETIIGLLKIFGFCWVVKSFYKTAKEISMYFDLTTSKLFKKSGYIICFVPILMNLLTIILAIVHTLRKYADTTIDPIEFQESSWADSVFTKILILPNLSNFVSIILLLYIWDNVDSQKVDEENVAEFGAPSVGQVVLNKNNDDE